MIKQKPTVSLLLFSLIFTLLCVSDAKSVIYTQCSQLSFTSNTPYELNVKSLFTSLVESASICSFNTLKISPPGDPVNAIVYGLFQCRGDLSYLDCRECVAYSASQLKKTCSLSIGGTIQFEGCLVKYDNTSFFGVDDKMEALKSCGPSIGYNSKVLNSRDDTLSSLIAQNGQYFRRGGSGSVQGVAQCIQDLTATDCQDCLADATEQLRSDCETSSWGDMFLGKCYARYEDQDIDSYRQNGTDNNKDNHHGSNTATILKVLAVIASILSTGGLSYYASVTKNNNVLKVNAQHTNTVINNVKEDMSDVKRKLEDAQWNNRSPYMLWPFPMQMPDFNRSVQRIPTTEAPPYSRNGLGLPTSEGPIIEEV